MEPRAAAADPQPDRRCADGANAVSRGMSDPTHAADPPLAADHPFVRDLEPNAANRVALTPVVFLERSALRLARQDRGPARPPCVHLSRVRGAMPPARVRARATRRAPGRHRRRHGAERAGAARGALRGAGARCAILNALNYRQDAATIAFCLDHGEAKVLLTDAEFAPIVKAALAQAHRDLLVVDIDDPEGPAGERLGRPHL